MLQQHIGLASVLLVIGFVVGIFGHITRSRVLILTGIVIIAVVSILLVGAGEVQTF